MWLCFSKGRAYLEGGQNAEGNLSCFEQDMFDPLLNEVKESHSRIEKLATDILTDTLSLIIKHMAEEFPENES